MHHIVSIRTTPDKKIDTGASKLIAEGKIKLKSGTLIQEITENGLKFEDGSEVSADVIIFATG
jgi:NADH dehydrogenase FAD-containing subunit